MLDTSIECRDEVFEVEIEVVCTFRFKEKARRVGLGRKWVKGRGGAKYGSIYMKDRNDVGEGETWGKVEDEERNLEEEVRQRKGVERRAENGEEVGRKSKKV